MKKNLVVLSIAILSLLAIIPVLAIGTSSNDPIILNNGGITLDATKELIVNNSLSNTTFQRDFGVDYGYGYVKVGIQNKGSSSVTFTVNKGSTNGPEVLSGTVAPKVGTSAKIQSFYTNLAVATGTYFITVSSGSAKMSGTVGIHVGTNLDKLKRN